MAFITPTPMNMPSISRLEKTIVAMEQVFRLRFRPTVNTPHPYSAKGLKRADASPVFERADTVHEKVHG
eukprot:scaffold21750_cov52-Phaeocystis_antarctica.AAC.2